MKILHRYTNKVLLEIVGDTLLGADLSYVDLSYTDLSYANLRDADLTGANIDDRIYTISRIGSANRQTTYNADKNIIWCGCFIGTIGEFEAKVKKTHPIESKHYHNYMAVIAYFKSLM
jgi:hypothetical protein